MIFIVYGVLLLCEDIQAVPLDSIVQFVCEGCVPKTNECCIGTAVSSKHFLTTNYCAETCQYVKIKKEIVLFKKIHVNPFPKTYVINDIYVGPNTIALVETETIKNNNHSFIKLETNKRSTFLDTSVSIVVYDEVPKFRKAKIIQCDRDSEFLNTYYVCAADETFESCDVPQGTPLFLDEQLLGITGIQNSKSCQYTKRIFIDLEPAIFWIQYILSDDLIINMRRVQEKTIIKNNLSKKKFARGSNKKNNQQIKFFLSKKGQSTNKNQISKQINIRNKKKIMIKGKVKPLKGKQNITTTKSYKFPSSHNIRKQNTKRKIKFMRTKMNKKYLNNKVSKTEKSRHHHHFKWNTTLNSQNKVISKKVQRLCSRPKQILKNTIKSKTQSSNKKMLTSILFLTGNTKKLQSLLFRTKKTYKFAKTLSTKIKVSSKKSTKMLKNKQQSTKKISAMEWFNKIKNKTKTNESQILVLTTSRVPLPEFIDLT
ncbi:unnamed protein product [Euphydryas editha]|uniref:Peptidase S1 domain-containing protein n=1 Tax=Euphydryas editha TaxID=104508 RepID=A0AAU9UYY6_EUPED|nr:unnamed protein product [Euphydryas editha]